MNHWPDFSSEGMLNWNGFDPVDCFAVYGCHRTGIVCPVDPEAETCESNSEPYTTSLTFDNFIGTNPCDD